jgi:hypothetical protein
MPNFTQGQEEIPADDCIMIKFPKKIFTGSEMTKGMANRVTFEEIGILLYHKCSPHYFIPVVSDYEENSSGFSITDTELHFMGHRWFHLKYLGYLKDEMVKIKNLQDLSSFEDKVNEKLRQNLLWIPEDEGTWRNLGFECRNADAEGCLIPANMSREEIKKSFVETVFNQMMGNAKSKLKKSLKEGI